eukprot:TRINITY_DN13050_c0_g1_i2.p1 TRINITY_DN13050_c0_g1~~TRINITY_DN13050_c0_g1_i2.p1  ORF type:complete len:198 (+),score=-9.28 TRINITY_DN13050_c0_g1_i2:75-596(+)
MNAFLLRQQHMYACISTQCVQKIHLLICMGCLFMNVFGLLMSQNLMCFLTLIQIGKFQYYQGVQFIYCSACIHGKTTLQISILVVYPTNILLLVVYICSDNMLITIISLCGKYCVFLELVFIFVLLGGQAICNQKYCAHATTNLCITEVQSILNSEKSRERFEFAEYGFVLKF